MTTSTELSTAPRPRSLSLPSAETLDTMRELAKVCYQAGQLPKNVPNPETAIMIGLYGAEIGFSFLHSLTAIHMIEGVPSLHYKDQLALIRRDCKGAEIEFLQQDAKACVIKATRPGQKPQTFTWAIEEAIQARYYHPEAAKADVSGKEAALKGWWGKDNWHHDPTDMLTARCVTRMNRTYFSDVSRGFCYTPEELVEAKEIKSAETGAPVDQAKKPDPIPRKQATAAAAAQEAKPEIEEAELVDATPPGVEPRPAPGSMPPGVNRASASMAETKEPATTEPAKKPEPLPAPGQANRHLLIDLAEALNITDDRDNVEKTFQGFVDKHKADAVLLMNAFDVYNQRLDNLQPKESKV